MIERRDAETALVDPANGRRALVRRNDGTPQTGQLSRQLCWRKGAPIVGSYR